jgi:hypothetical protein
MEEAQKIRRQIPMPPYLAKFAKDHPDADFLIKYGWNLTEAEYGSDWLNFLAVVVKKLKFLNNSDQ